MPKQIWKIDRFHGGLNSNSDPRDILDDELSAATDIMVDEAGKIRTMGGTAAHDAGTNDAAITAGYGIHYFSHDQTYANINLTGSHTGANNQSGALAQPMVNSNANFVVNELAGAIINNTTDGSSTTIVSNTATNIVGGLAGGTGNDWDENDTYIIELPALETGDDYLAMADTDGAGDIDIYSRDTDNWGISRIDTGNTTGMKPTFYSVDGALRVSDGNFGSGNANKWFGYIDRDFFQTCDGDTVSVDEWKSEYQRIDKPSDASVFDNVITGGSTTYDEDHALTEVTTGVNFFDTENDLFDAGTTNVSKIVVVVNATRDGTTNYSLLYDLKVGQSANGTASATTFSAIANETKEQHVHQLVGHSGLSRTHTFTFTPTDLPQADSATNVGIRVYCDFTGTGSDINLKEIDSVTVYRGTGAAGSHPELGVHVCNFEIAFGGSGASGWDKNWNVGCSFIYDGLQESLIQQIRDQDLASDYDLTAATSAQSPIIKFNMKYADWNERITGINLYMREASSTAIKDWFKQCSYDLIKGKGRAYPNGLDVDFTFTSSIAEYSCEISRDKLLSPNLVNSFRVETGMKYDEESIICNYKTAVVANRRVYVGGLRLLKEDGTTEVKSDAMLKTPVNKFDIFPSSNIIEASVRDGDEIVILEEYADRILQFKKNKMHIINVSQELEFLEETLMHKGVAHPAATCKTDFGIAWVNKLGCYLYNGKNVTNLLEKKGRQIIKESDWTVFTSREPMIGYLPKKRQLIVVDDITTNGNGNIFLYDMVTQSWVEGSNDASTRAFDKVKTNFITDWNGDLVYAHTAGTVVKWDDTSDVTDTISFKTKDIDFGQPAQRKKIYKVYISYRGDGSAVTVGYRTNGETTATIGNFYRITSATDGSSSGGTDSTLPLWSGTAGTTDWLTAELKPVLSINNVNSFQLFFDGTAAADFEINDISIVYKSKSVR